MEEHTFSIRLGEGTEFAATVHFDEDHDICAYNDIVDFVKAVRL